MTEPGAPVAAGDDAAKPPVVRGRLLGTLSLSIAFLVSMSTGIASRQVLIPVYMVTTAVFVTAFNWIEVSRLGFYMKNHFPDEYRRLISRGGGHLTLLPTRIEFAFSAGSGDPGALAELRRRARRIWASLLVLPYVMIVILVGVELSR